MEARAEKLKEFAKKAFDAQDYHGAVTFYTEAIKFNSQNAEYWADRALVYVELKEYDSALQDASNAIQMDSSLYKGFYSRGMTYFAITDFNVALRDLQQADILNPNNDDIRRRLQDCQEAIIALRRTESEEESQVQVEPPRAKRILLYAALFPLLAAIVIMVLYLAIYFRECFSDGLGLECFVMYGSFVIATLIALALTLCEMRGFQWLQQLCFLRKGHPAFRCLAFALGVVACIPVSFTRPITFRATLAAVLMVVWGFMVDVATDLDLGLSGVFSAVLVSIGIVPVAPTTFPSSRKDDNVAWLIVVGFLLGGVSACIIDLTKTRFVLGNREIMERRIREEARKEEEAVRKNRDAEKQIARVNEENMYLIAKLELLDVKIGKKNTELTDLLAQSFVADVEMTVLKGNMAGLEDELHQVERMEKKNRDEIVQLEHHYREMICQVSEKEEELNRSRQIIEDLNLQMRKRVLNLHMRKRGVASPRRMDRHKRTTSSPF